jgi:homoserine kinase type II
MIREAAERFFGPSGYEIAQSTGGMNNTTRQVRTGEGTYILRLYNTHQDAAKAEFEHDVLIRLARSGSGLSFRVPEPVRALEGRTVIRLQPSGKLAAAFRYICGHMPDLGQPEQALAFGKASGELSRQLALIEKELPEGWQPAYPPYYELDHAHASCPLPEAALFCSDPPAEFGGARESLRFLADEITRIRPILAELRSLPHQLIHGDLNASNALLAEDGSIAALLDFEFVTTDLRAMEAAVCLSGLIPDSGEACEEEAVWEVLAAFWQGFQRANPLTAAETAVVPVLMQLRNLDVFLHFLGRYKEGVDDSSVLAGQIPDTSARMKWIAANGERLSGLLQS